MILGLSQLTISMATLAGLMYYGKLPVKYLTVNYLSLITAASLFAFLMSFVVYLASRNASSKEPSGNYSFKKRFCHQLSVVDMFFIWILIVFPKFVYQIVRLALKRYWFAISRLTDPTQNLLTQKI